MTWFWTVVILRLDFLGYFELLETTIQLPLQPNLHKKYHIRHSLPVLGPSTETRAPKSRNNSDAIMKT